MRAITDDIRRSTDLRAVCVHEHARAVVAKRFHVHGVASACPDGEPASERQARLIGLAGVIAEEIDREPGVTAPEIFEALDLRVIEIPECDAAQAGAYTQTDVEECEQLVRGSWLAIDARARLEAGRFLRAQR